MKIKALEHLTLPWPPSVNGYWRSIQRGKYATQILSQRAREYQALVKSIVGFRPLATRHTGRLRVAIILHPPTRRKVDLDNFNKGLLDSLTKAGVWEDDSQIDDLRIIRGEIIKGGRAAVTIEEIKCES